MSLEQTLRAVRGKPLQMVGRASTMLWISIGAPQIVPTFRDPSRVVGEFALHVQCPWRFIGLDGVVAGSSDMYERHPSVPEWDFDPGTPGNSVADFQIRDWTTRYAGLIIESAEVDRLGAISLRFSAGFAFETFPNCCGRSDEPIEYWRIFDFGEDTPHYVMTDRGLYP